MIPKGKTPPDLLVGLACQMGLVDAVSFAEFKESLDELDDGQRKLLMRGWLALGSIRGDSSLERADLVRVLRALRDAWIRLGHPETHK